MCADTLVLLGLAAAIPVSAAQPTVSYTALSDAARKAGSLALYRSHPTTAATAKLGACVLEAEVPRSARAYDVVPIRYTLKRPADARRCAVEAVAFENAKKRAGKPLYDLAIPGNMDVKVEYLGSVSADFDQLSYIPLTPDPKTPVSPFPPYKRDQMVRSSTVREAQAVWFKFRITNTGDTILDPEGFGAAFTEPRLAKLDRDGNEEWSAGTVNQYERFLTYLYPGDSVVIWANFYTPKLGGQWCRGLTEGDYRLDLRMLYRYHREYSWAINIWTGAEFARLTVPFRVAKTPAQTLVEPRFRVTDTAEKMPGDYDTFEEFMTSFKVYSPSPQPSPPGEGATSPSTPAPLPQGERGDGPKPPGEVGQVVRDTLYLQVAPWTTHVVLKLILTDPREITVATVPIKITRETLEIRHNPKNVMVLMKSGREEPVIVAQAMPGMRAGFQLGPYPEEHMLRDIREMKALGINVIANTSGNWWIPEIAGRKEVELHSACYKYWYDVLVPKMDMTLMGWSVYPPSGVTWYIYGSPLLARKKLDYSTSPEVYGFEAGVDMGDPLVPQVIAAWARYNHARWGDRWFRTKDGRVPVDIEDTWGWMRDDINLRYSNGPLALQRFRDWVKAKYGSIDSANRAWGSAYKDFDEIDPEKNQGIEGDGLTYGPVYNKPEHPFHDWSPAVDDWDTFRTELRMEIYRGANEMMRKDIPGAELALRCEGANLTVKGDPTSDNMHWRHVYYSQRRNAMVQDAVDKADVLHFFSDYTTLPYTEQEWRLGIREMVSRGIIPVFLPQFDHMRDILLQPHYGREYQMHYNLDKPTKGMMVHCLMAAFPWWKATYEEGGAPGIIWSDYQCDGFATETQKREVKLLREQFGRMRRAD